MKFQPLSGTNELLKKSLTNQLERRDNNNIGLFSASSASPIRRGNKTKHLMNAAEKGEEKRWVREMRTNGVRPDALFYLFIYLFFPLDAGARTQWQQISSRRKYEGVCC